MPSLTQLRIKNRKETFVFQDSAVSASTGQSADSVANPILVTSVFGRTGAVVLTLADIIGSLGYTPISAISPMLLGVPTAPKPPFDDNSSALATTAWVKEQPGFSDGLVITEIGDGLVLSLGTLSSEITSVFGRTGTITLQASDVSTALTYVPAPTASPAFTGVPTAPTPFTDDSSNRIATTAFVQNAIPSLGGTIISSVGPALHFSAGHLSTDVISVFGRIGTIVLTSSDVTTALTFAPAPIASPVFTGIPTTPTATFGNDSTTVASTAFVQAAIAPFAPLLQLANVQVIGAGLTLGTGTLAASVISVFGRSGNIVLTASDIALALTYTPAATNAAVGYAQLPLELQQLPLGFVIAGQPAASQPFHLVMAMAITIPANFAGTVIYAGTIATANAIFTINKISGGSTTTIGTITVTSASHTSVTFSTQAQVSLAIGNVIQLICPSVQDATLSDLGITILCAKI